MNEFLSRFTGGQIIGLAAVIIGPIALAIINIAVQWRRVQVAQLDASLKEQMLEKGMSSSEIAQVMKASQDRCSTKRTVFTGNAALDKAALLQRMVDNWYDGEDIERVLNAYQHAPKQAEENPFAHKE